MTDILDSLEGNDDTIETALAQLLYAAQANNDDVTGTYTVPASGPDTPAYTVDITVEPTADDTHSRQPTEERVSYCLDCGWRVSTAGYSVREVSSRIVEHAVETGHDIESDDTPLVASRIDRSRLADHLSHTPSTSDESPGRSP